MFEWLWSLLYSIGFWKKEASVLLLGLDNAGKTTLLHRLKHGDVRLFIPTQRAQAEELTIGNLKLSAWDLGGHEAVRNLWADYFFEADAIVFVVDSADAARLDEARKELHALLGDAQLGRTPFLVLGNKADVKGSPTRDQLVEQLGLGEVVSLEPLATSERRPLEVVRCSAMDGTGYGTGFTWLSGVVG